MMTGGERPDCRQPEMISRREKASDGDDTSLLTPENIRAIINEIINEMKAVKGVNWLASMFRWFYWWCRATCYIGSLSLKQ